MAKDTYDNHYYIHSDNDDIKRCTICGRPYSGPGTTHATCVVRSGKGAMIESGIGWLLHFAKGGGLYDDDTSKKRK